MLSPSAIELFRGRSNRHRAAEIARNRRSSLANEKSPAEAKLANDLRWGSSCEQKHNQQNKNHKA